jgi:3-oxoacyl-[acyl-carrier protein] reductase
MVNNGELSNKTAIVTGASRGLGLATARRLHAAGACVVINYYPDPEGHHAALAQQATGELGDRCLALPADVRVESQTRKLVDQAKQHFGSFDILVNNAGVLRDKTIAKMTESQWQDVIDTNLTGVFHMCQLAAQWMNDGGRIVNLASISGCIGFFGQANYAASKAGVIGLTKVLSRELGKRHITVNAVAPGVVLTDMGKSIPEASLESMLQQIPLGRFGQPEDIAAAIHFLCGPGAAYITGQTLHVNGGWFG